MAETHVVTCFLRHRGDVLLLHRNRAVGTDAGRWGTVAGHVEPGPDEDASADRTPEVAARAEIAAATGLADAVTLVRVGESFPVEDTESGTRRVVHPFLFDCDSRAVETDEATAEAEWAAPPEILRRETVPDLWESYDRVRPRVETVAADREHGSASLSLRALEVLRDEAALAADRGDGWEGVAATARELLTARPSMTVVGNRVDRAMSAAAAGDRTPAAVERAAGEVLEAALDADAAAAATAADRVAGERVVTLSRSGTVARAVERADPAAVLVGESRPGGEGVGTAERFADAGHDVTLAPDAALAHELAAGDWDAVLVGADTVLPDGRVLNKVGTRGLALAAAREAVPVYAVAASDKVSPEDTVHAEAVDPTTVYDGEADLTVSTALFDVTPADCVAGVATEDGLLDADEVAAVAEAHRERADWR